VTPADQKTAREMLAELCEVEEGLTDWEVRFVDDLSKRAELSTFRFTPRQFQTLVKIHSERA
jgi:hypothetical protein